MQKTLVLLLLILYLSVSCSAIRFLGYLGGRDNVGGRLKDTTFESRDVVYEIGKLAPGWELIDLKKGDIAFYSGQRRATITVNSTCHDNTSHSLKALSDSQVIGIKSKRELLRTAMRVDGQDAMAVVWEGMLDGVPIKIAGVVFKDEGCIFDFTYSSLPEMFPRAYGEFIEFLDGFGVIRRK